MMRLLQIGAGMVGRVIARDLSRDFKVTAFDGSESNLVLLDAGSYGMEAVRGSVDDDELVGKLIEGADFICLALPGHVAVKPAAMAITRRKPVCDISSIPNEILLKEFGALTKEHDTVYLPKVGIAPGMTNFLVGRGASQMDCVEDVSIYVGGIPSRPVSPLGYKTVFCLKETLQEYLDPATIVRDGEKVVADALSDLHHVHFDGVGEVEAFITDGLATLSETVAARNMAEYTVRWPGHAEQMATLIDLGLLDSRKKRFGRAEFAPIDYLADLLGPLWKMDPRRGDRDVTVFRVVVTGFREGRAVEFSWELVDRYDEERDITSMGRCTGFTCATFVRALREGLISRKGVVGPERVASSDDLYRFVMEELAGRGVSFRESVTCKRDFEVH